MPFFSEVFYCPNRDCEYDDKLKKDEKCPRCGTLGAPFGLREAIELKKSKHTRVKVAQKIEAGSVQLLVTDDMTDEEIRKRIYEDMMNLAGHETGTSWMRVGTLISGNSTDQMLGAGFKALIDQNKIMIRQNELIRRALTKPPPPP